MKEKMHICNRNVKILEDVKLFWKTARENI
jgi:hypothetical protein